MSTSADSADTSDCTVGLNQRGSPVKLLSFSLKTSLDSASKGDSFRNNRWCDNLVDNQERGAKAKVLYTFNSREITENPNAIRLIMAVDFGHVLFRFLDSRSQVEYRVLSNQRHNAATIRCPHKNGQQRYSTTRRQRISLPANLLLTRCSCICAYPPCPSRVYTSFYEGTEYVMKQGLSLARPILQQKSKYPRKILWTMCGVVDFLECRRKQRANITYSFFRWNQYGMPSNHWHIMLWCMYENLTTSLQILDVLIT